MLARAKINLGLEVDEVDANGLHPLRTIFAEISLADELTAEPAPAWQLDVGGNEQDCPPNPEDNLVWRAEELVMAVSRQGKGKRIGHGWRVNLVKRIPAGAGLGGASSDAAAWIRFQSRKDPALADALWRAAADLGKDIPFFRHGGVQFGSGYGEGLRPIAAPGFRPYVILANPGRPLSTAAVYRAFDQVARVARPRVNLETIERAIVAGTLPEVLENQLEPAAYLVDSALREFSVALRRWSGGVVWWLSGSGATYYILERDQDRAAWLHETIHRRVPRVWMAQVVPERPAMERG